MTTRVTVSCGCKNEENRASLPNLDRDLVDGTMLCGIKKDRKLNKNNTSGVRGVHFDNYGWHKLCFKEKLIFLIDLKLRKKP